MSDTGTATIGLDPALDDLAEMLAADREAAGPPAGSARPAGGRAARRTLTLRRIDLWSALKLSLVVYLTVFTVLLGAGVVLWSALRHSGAIGHLEKLIEDLGGYAPHSFHFRDGVILHYVGVVGPILVVLGALATVAAVGIFNVIARLTGGVTVHVSDDEAVPGL